MIARLALGEPGPVLGQPRRFGSANRLVVVLSADLSTTAPPHRWPDRPRGRDVLEARVRSERLYARSSLVDAAGGLPRAPSTRNHRALIVPEQALRARRSAGHRGARARRPRRLSRYAFRDTAGRRDRLRRHLVVAAALASLVVLGVTAGSIASSARALAHLEADRRSLERVREAIVAFENEARRREASDEPAAAAQSSPVELISRIVSVLEPGELIGSVRLSGDRLTVVVASSRGLDVARAIGALPGVRDAVGTVRAEETRSTVTVEARVGGAR